MPPFYRLHYARLYSERELTPNYILLQKRKFKVSEKLENISKKRKLKAVRGSLIIVLKSALVAFTLNLPEHSVGNEESITLFIISSM